MINYVLLKILKLLMIMQERIRRGINFVGYVFYHTHTLIRKSIKYDWCIYVKNRKENVKPQT